MTSLGVQRCGGVAGVGEEHERTHTLASHLIIRTAELSD